MNHSTRFTLYAIHGVAWCASRVLRACWEKAAFIEPVYHYGTELDTDGNLVVLVPNEPAEPDDYPYSALSLAEFARGDWT